VLKVGFFYLLAIGFAYLFARSKNREKSARSLQVAKSSLLRVVPLLLAIFSLVGLFEVYCPPELVKSWLGATSGWQALLTGGLAGAIAIGPPLAAFPLAGSLLESGAWAPAVAAFIVSWISVGIITLPYEASVFGIRFALARNALAFVAALLVGFCIGVLL
jgi:uncharacterized membrane protein YraQ (UPF0718 family)